MTRVHIEVTSIRLAPARVAVLHDVPMEGGRGVGIFNAEVRARTIVRLPHRMQARQRVRADPFDHPRRHQRLALAQYASACQPDRVGLLG